MSNLQTSPDSSCSLGMPVDDDIFRTLFERSEAGMYFTDLDGRMHPNAAFCRMLGYADTELSGRSFADVTHPDDLVESERIFSEVISGRGQQGRLRRRFVTSDGRALWADLTTAVVRDPDGRPLRFQSVVIDISHRVSDEGIAAAATDALERRVAQRTAQLEASNRELESFSYSVSHDLRAPLRAVAGFSRLLEKKYAATLDETASGYVRRIVEGTDRMGEMIDDLLRFSRLGRQELKLRLVDPALLAREALQDLQADIDGRDVEVVIEEMPPVWADRALLHHVYVNLLSNAIKFTARQPRAKVLVRAVAGEDGVPVYSVEDNGAGFDMAYAHKLFGVFQRLHGRADYEGTGVGLALVKGIVERHDGRVWATAGVDTGANFFFTIGGQP